MQSTKIFNRHRRIQKFPWEFFQNTSYDETRCERIDEQIKWKRGLKAVAYPGRPKKYEMESFATIVNG